MYTNRLFPLLVAVALAAVAAFAVHQPIATTAVVTGNSYDSIEQIRAVRNLVSNVEIDGEYDLIEQLRTDRTGNSLEAERDYDPIELLRTQRRNSFIFDPYNAIENLRIQRHVK